MRITDEIINLQSAQLLLAQAQTPHGKAEAGKEVAKIANRIRSRVLSTFDTVFLSTSEASILLHILGSQGRIISVITTRKSDGGEGKRIGSPHQLTGRFGVRKGVKGVVDGVDRRLEDHRTANETFYVIGNAHPWKRINLEGLQEIRACGKCIKVRVG